MCLGLRGLHSFRGGCGNVVCVCAGFGGIGWRGLSRFASMEMLRLSAGVRFLACDDASCWLSFLPSQVR